MRKVLYVIDSLQTGGAEKSTLDIASRLRIFTPVVCHIYKNDFLKSEFEKKGIRVISLNIEGPYDFIRAYRMLKKVLIQERPSLVVATLLRSELISRIACRMLLIPNIGTFVSDSYSKYEWELLPISMKFKVGFFRILNMVTARYCTSFLSNSASIKESNCKALFIPRKKVAVIYRGRSSDEFVFTGGRFADKRIRLLAVGRLMLRKGHGELIKAFHQFRQDHPEATLTLAGEGPFRSHLESLIRDFELERFVTLAGNVKDVSSLMRTHDIFVFPSHYEGFSGALVEAMLSGIPIVASAIPMNLEAVCHGVTARLFPVQNTEAMAGEIAWVYKNQQEAIAMAVNARRVAEEKFDITFIARQHDAYYEQCVSKLK